MICPECNKKISGQKANCVINRGWRYDLMIYLHEEPMLSPVSGVDVMEIDVCSRIMGATKLTEKEERNAKK